MAYGSLFEAYRSLCTSRLHPTSGTLAPRGDGNCNYLGFPNVRMSYVVSFIFKKGWVKSFCQILVFRKYFLQSHCRSHARVIGIAPLRGAAKCTVDYICCLSQLPITHWRGKLFKKPILVRRKSELATSWKVCPNLSRIGLGHTNYILRGLYHILSLNGYSLFCSTWASTNSCSAFVWSEKVTTWRGRGAHLPAQSHLCIDQYHTSVIQS